ncbi:GerMN domain-containing protein [Natranaerobius thermophilus]|uniref:GerMN domain-containing protein n=1 Tax=Natranaerobius thermophilus (strain ATCC BAA-1301 / DSM 18059 / JW/NM-WN-LF) TaxID=457570 RepID=B2A6J1_NATTJ|nr:GerMN domain-containing protein [Natranaerobius thermophilus]ACB85524.1 conserved hypothetical protein [Natranaerobius thermophilus JW/NM-WN-LF]
MGKVKLIVLIIVISSMALLLSGCFFLDFIFGPDPDETTKEEQEELEPKEDEPTEIRDYDEDEKRETVFYLLDNNDNLVPVVKPIEWTEGIATKTLNKMSQTPANEEFWMDTNLTPTLPNGTKVKGMAIDDGRARVNFTEEFLDMEPESEQEIKNSIVYTLSEFETIDEVEIMVEGEFIESLPGGTDVSGPLTREGLNVEITAEAESAENETGVNLYFLSQDGEYVVPVTRYIPDTEELEGNAIYELMKGADPDSGLISYVSTDLDINDVKIEGNTMQMDVSNLADDPEHQELALKQLKFTLTDFDYIDSMEISIDGTPIDIDERVMNLEEVNFRY